MKKAILKKMDELEGKATLIDLIELPGFEGNLALRSEIVCGTIWVGFSDAFYKAITQLHISDAIYSNPVSADIYHNHKSCTLLYSIGSFKRLPFRRWAPAILTRGPRFYEVLNSLSV